MKKNHILITGANGFVGKHLQRSLISSGFKVSIAVRSHLDFNEPDVNSYLIDLAERNKVFEFIQSIKPDYVIHLAWKKNWDNGLGSISKGYDPNVSIAINLIDACRNLLGLKRFIFLGSCDEYGIGPRPYSENQYELPISTYGLSKLFITKLLLSLFHTCSFPAIILRPSVIYGPEQNNEMFIPSLIHSLILRKKFAMTHGEQLRDFIYISDVVQAILKVLLIDEHINAEVINIGFGVSYKVKHIAEMIANQIEPITALGRLKFGEKEYRPNEVMDYSLNVSLATRLLDWTPEVDIDEGIQKTVNYFNQSHI